MSDQINTVKKNGFANMDPEKLKELGSRGGKACVAAGKRPCFTSETARQASLKAREKRALKAQLRDSSLRSNQVKELTPEMDTDMEVLNG